MLKEPSTVVWHLVTLHGKSEAGERKLTNVDPAQVAYYDDLLQLFDLSLLDATPPADVFHLNFEGMITFDDTQKNIVSYVVRGRVRDFIDYMDSDPNRRILARNVRNYIKKSNINPKIRATFEDKPDEFWYSHNGITMICDRASVVGNRITLVHPSVINGGQTLSSLQGAPNRDSSAEVLVRIVVLPPVNLTGKELVKAIIVRTNQQNKIYTYDLVSNNQEQVEWAKNFLSHRVFYERRRGDWDDNSKEYQNRGLARLRITELAQILMSSEPKLGGVANAKKNVEALFEIGTSKRLGIYEKLFSVSFDQAFFKYMLHSIVWDSIYMASVRNVHGTLKNHAILTCYSIAWNCLRSAPDIDNWIQKVNLQPSLVDRNTPKTAELEKVLGNVFKSCWNEWKKANDKDETVSPNNFFKSNKENERLLGKMTNKFVHPLREAISMALDDL